MSANKNMNSLTKADTSVAIKFGALSVLVVQNALLVLVMRYSQLHPREGEPIYLATSAVLMGEVIKIIASAWFLLLENAFRAGETANSIAKCLTVFSRPKELLNLSVPAFLYVVQNNLVYLATANLDPAPFQLLFQLKIFSTAVLSVWLLDKTLTKEHWRALIMLFCGVLIVQMSIVGRAQPDQSDANQRPMIGLAAILVAVTCSGLSGVWFERILKGSSASLWLRNIQLAAISLILAMTSILGKDFARVQKDGLFSGYSPVVWSVIFLQSGGGLVVALVVKYADNILKGFATSIATIVSTLASMLVFDFQLTTPFSVGAVLVLTSAYLYNRADIRSSSKTKADHSKGETSPPAQYGKV